MDTTEVAQAIDWWPRPVGGRTRIIRSLFLKPRDWDIHRTATDSAVQVARTLNSTIIKRYNAGRPRADVADGVHALLDQFFGERSAAQTELLAHLLDVLYPTAREHASTTLCLSVDEVHTLSAALNALDAAQDPGGCRDALIHRCEILESLINPHGVVNGAAERG